MVHYVNACLFFFVFYERAGIYLDSSSRGLELTESPLGSECTERRPSCPEKRPGCCTWPGCRPCDWTTSASHKQTPLQMHSDLITEDKSDLLVLFTSFWCSVKTRSFVSGGIKTKSMEASSSRTSLRGGLGDPKSSFVCGAKRNENQLYNG